MGSNVKRRNVSAERRGDMENLMAKFKLVYTEFEKLTPIEMQVALCMLIDKTAHENGVASLELMDTLRPLIDWVNSNMGSAGL